MSSVALLLNDKHLSLRGRDALKVHGRAIEIGPECRDLYIGSEAFADIPRLIKVLSFCSTNRIRPNLLSWGQQFDEYESTKALLGNLRRITPLTIISVGDQESWSSVALDRFELWLRAVKAAGITAEILFLSESGRSLPKSLLEMGQINTDSSVYPRIASGLAEFFVSKGWSIIYSNRQEPSSAEDKPLQRMNRSSIPKPPDDTLYSPMAFNSLVIETTHFCNAKCAHCYTSCGPDVSKKRLSTEKLKQVISEAAQLPNLVRHCHVGGGEATIFWGEMIEVLTHAKREKFTNSIVTNGWWAKEPKVTARKVHQLLDAGVVNVELSVDAMHYEFISAQRINQLIRAASEAKIKVTLRICTTKTRRADDILRHIETNLHPGLVIAVSRVTAIGRAKDSMPASDLFMEEGLPPGSCHSMLNLTISPNGDVFPCCAGSEVCSSLKLGNVNQASLSHIALSVRGNEFVRTLVHAGPAYFAALLSDAGVSDWMKPRYGNICQLCTDICSDHELSTLIEEKLGDRLRDLLPVAMRAMSI